MVNKQTKASSKVTADNFKWVTAEPTPTEAFITLDNQERLYFNATTKKLFGSSREFFLGYDATTKTLIIADASHSKLHGVKPFRLDSRSYAKAHVMVERFRINPAHLPLRYEYKGTEVIDGVESLLFRLT
jgi:hypothetical protein